MSNNDLKFYPKDIVDDADSREPWSTANVRNWYMEGRLVERELAAKGNASTVGEDGK